MKAFEIAEGVKNGKLSAEEVVKASLSAIAAREKDVNAFLEVFEGEALARAKELDAKRASGKPLGLLAGVPVALKDNIMYKGHNVFCASKMLEGHVASYSATAVERLLAEDAVIMGRANMDEFAMGSSCENSAFKKTANPHDLSRVPGGSSGGSAAAVAAGMTPIALGSDTGGSVRQPASFCGITAIKPTYGLMSRYGLVAFASSLDQIGPMAADARDCALALTAMAGHDPKDSTSAEVKPGADYHGGHSGSVKGLKIGLPKEYFVGGIDPEVEKLVMGAAKKFQSMGAELVEVSLPHTKYAVAAYYIVASSEASSNLARFDGIRYGYSAAKDDESLSLAEVFMKSRGRGFGPEVKRRIMLGTYSLSSGYYDAYYAQAQKIRALLKRDFFSAFEKADVLLGPACPTPAFKFGEKVDDPLQMYLSDIYTIPCNMAGVPGLSLNCGKTSGGLPVGMQLFGKPLSERTLFNAAMTFERGN